jgi:voltage-gated potassium channel
MRSSAIKIRYLIILPLVVLAVGTAGFMAIEKLSFIDALYFTIVTITTVGYGDIHPLTTGGKIFDIFLIVIGISSFLAILTNIAQMLIQRGQLRLHRYRLNMLIGVFFTEVGNQLLRIFTRFDPEIDKVRQDLIVTDKWSEAEFRQLKRRLGRHEHAVSPQLLELDTLHRFLQERGDILLRELENPDLVENETFTGLLWAIVHLRDELAARDTLQGLPESDVAHLANDVKRAYNLLSRQWTDYLQFLKSRYPFLFSLALRTNPFVENPSPVVR